MYTNGRGVKQDFVEAARWYRKAADQGHAGAQCNLGFAFYQGQGVKQDFVEAARLYRKAADQGFANAQNNLGVAYGNGQGAKLDFGEALRWFRKAAAQGHEGAKKAVPLVEEGLRKQRQAVAQASQPSSSRTCANCGVAEAAGGEDLKPCSRCKAVVYCGKECQMQHWKAGGPKAVCK
jgi:TPR repeat protein